MDQSLASIWVPDDLQKAKRTSIDVLYDANRLIDAATSGTADDLTRAGVNLISSFNEARDAIRPVVRELIDACRAIGDPVPVLNGVADECVTGLVVAFALDVASAFGDSYESATGFGMKVYSPKSSIPPQAYQRIRDKLRSREMADGKNLRRLIDVEIRRAASSRISAQSVAVIEIPADDTEPKPTKKSKRSTERGEARKKLISAFTLHHQYADDSCLNQDSIGSNELARKATVSPDSASRFFQEKFGSHLAYRGMCKDLTLLLAALKLLNGEMTPTILFNQLPNEQADAKSDDDDDDD